MKKSLPLFAIVTLLFVIAAWFSVHQRSPETAAEKAPLYPELTDRIKDIARVDIKTHDEHTVLALKDGHWVIENRGNYPALFGRIKPLVLAISELVIHEAKTANPELYSRLQVEDVTADKAKSRQVILQDAQGNTLVSLLIGKDRVNRSDGSVDSLYVRRAGEEQSYLVKGDIMLSADPADWLDNSLIDISSDQLHKISIEHGGDQAVQAIKDQQGAVNYKLQNIPQGFKVKSQTTVNSLASAVEDLHFDDVKSTADFKWPADALMTTYETFDGLVVHVKSAKIEDRMWAAFSFEFTGEEKANESGDEQGKAKKPSVKEQVDMLNAKTEGWVYVLPSYKVQMLTRPLADLIIEEGADAGAAKTNGPISPTTSMPPELPQGMTPEMLQNMMQQQSAPSP